MSDRIFIKTFLGGMSPMEELTVTEWADKYVYLPKATSAEHGKYFTDRTPYIRDVLDTLTDPDVTDCVTMFSAQVGKTTAIQIMVAFIIGADPDSMLFTLPTEQLAKEYGNTRIDALVNATPQTRGLIADRGSGTHHGSTAIRKVFPGGNLYMAWPGSPATLAGRPVRYAFTDEIDRQNFQNGPDGDPCDLIKQRTETFLDRAFRYWSSTPLDKNTSKIEYQYENSDKRKYYVPCTKCGEKQILLWGNMRWDRTPDGEPDFNSVRYVCPYCKNEMRNGDKYKMISHGAWIADRPFNGVAGFWLNALYSPWATWENLVNEFHKANKEFKRTGDKTSLKAFINLKLAETFEDQQIKIDFDSLTSLREDYGAEVPLDVRVIVASVDVQDDRLEYLVAGFTADEQMYIIKYGIVTSDPSMSETWEDLEDRLQRYYSRKDGVKLYPSCTVIDTGGHHTQTVYNEVKRRMSQRWFCIKGSNQSNMPIVGRPRRQASGIDLYFVGTDTAKDQIFAMLNNALKTDYAVIHFPLHDDIDNDFFRSLTAERRTMKKNRNKQMVYVWEKIRQRNEVLDLCVYILAAIHIVSPDWQLLKQNENKYISGKSNGKSSKKKKRRMLSKGIE